MRHGKLFALVVWFGLACAGAAAADGRSIQLEGASEATLPFTLIDNRIFVPVTVNGRGPYQFIFDTGGQNILDVAVARELGLKLESAEDASGAGAATEQAWRTDVDLATIGTVAMREQEFRVLSFDAIRRAIGFRRLDGLVGRELFERFVVDIDYAASRLSFAEPSVWRPAADLGQAQPLRLVYDIPALSIVVDGLSGLAVLDTGDRSSFTLFGPFVKRHGLRTRYAKKVQAVTGWGIGGPIPAEVTRVDRLEIGGRHIRDVVMRMPLLERGAFATSSAAGSIGTGVLKRFRVVFDYSRKRMFLAPNNAINAADPADRSGLWLSQSDAGFKVMSVVPGSPADQSGIKVDDVVTAVDGVETAKLFLVELRDRLKAAAPGTRIRLGLKTGTSTRDVTITLRDLI